MDIPTGTWVYDRNGERLGTVRAKPRHDTTSGEHLFVRPFIQLVPSYFRIPAASVAFDGNRVDLTVSEAEIESAGWEIQVLQ